MDDRGRASENRHILRVRNRHHPRDTLTEEIKPVIEAAGIAAGIGKTKPAFDSHNVTGIHRFSLSVIGIITHGNAGCGILPFNLSDRQQKAVLFLAFSRDGVNNTRNRDNTAVPRRNDISDGKSR